MYKNENYIAVMVPEKMYADVCAVLAGRGSSPVEAPKVSSTAETVTEQVSSTETSVPATVSIADTGSPDVDAHGHVWSEELHASTKGTTKDGLWRMKVGVSRPDPLPGFPVEATTSTTEAGAETPLAASAQTETAPATATSTDEDDEFAAFRNAAAEADKADAAAKASVPARKWTDADLGALCNAAAVKLGDPAPVRDIITTHVPEGVVAHSRNIPEEAREDFAKAVEAKAGIEFAG